MEKNEKSERWGEARWFLRMRGGCTVWRRRPRIRIRPQPFLGPPAIYGSTALKERYYRALVVPAVNRGITVLPYKGGAE